MGCFHLRPGSSLRSALASARWGAGGQSRGRRTRQRRPSRRPRASPHRTTGVYFWADPEARSQCRGEGRRWLREGGRCLGARGEGWPPDVAAGNTPASGAPGALAPSAMRGGAGAEAGMGSGVSQQLRTRVWRNSPRSFPWNRRRPLPGSKLAGASGRLVGCGRSSEGRSPGQPWEARPPDCPSIVPEHTGPAPPLPPPPPSPPPGERVLRSQELLATARRPLQMCTAGPGLPRPRWMGGRGLPARRRWQGQGTCWEPEGQEGQWRRGLARPPSPQAASAANANANESLFTARGHDFLLLEKRPFYRGLRDRAGQRQPSRMNQKHVDTLPDTKPCPAPFLPQLDPGDLHLTQPQELGNRGNLLLCPLRLRGDGFWGGGRPCSHLGQAPHSWVTALPAGQSWGWSPPDPASAEAPPAVFRAGRERQAVMEGRPPSSSSYQGRGGPDATVY